MSAAAMVSFRTPVLPWALATDDEIRFRWITQRVLLLCAVIFIAMPWLPVFKPDPAKPVELAAPMARLLIEQAVLPPPPPVVKAKPEAARPLEREIASNKPEPEKPASRPIHIRLPTSSSIRAIRIV